MSKIKVPKNWTFKYFKVEDGITKFVYEDNLGQEHIYINQEIEQDIPSYEELQQRINKAIKYVDTWGYDEYELFRIDENNPNFTTNEDVPTIVKTLKNILKGVDKE